MLCNRCQKRLATVHMTKLEQGQLSKIQLCDDCANHQMGSESIPQILSALIGGESPPMDMGQIEGLSQRVVKCESCGSSFNDIHETGRVGCGDCYAAFDENMGLLILKVQGADSHRGKIPSRTGVPIVQANRLVELTDLLNRLILSEDYERAAEVRDQIRDLQPEVLVVDE